MNIQMLIAALALALAGCVANRPPFPPDADRGVEPPVGLLGYRIGTYLTIEGVRVDGAKTGAGTLRVEKVNGYTLPKPVQVWVEETALPEGQRYVMKGYESGWWIGMPPQVLEATDERGPQALWQFCFVFIPVSFEYPDN